MGTSIRNGDMNRGKCVPTVFAGFCRLRKQKRFCDFTIRAGQHEIPVHKCLIAASSEYFDLMLSHDTKENLEGYVDIKGVDPLNVVKCVDYMYSGTLPDNEENPVDVLRVAHMLQLHELCHELAMMIKEELSIENVIPIRQIAKIYDSDELVRSCDKLAIEKFHEVMKVGSFNEAQAEYLQFLLSSKDLNLFDDIKCKAIMTWVSHEKERSSQIFDLMKQVDIVKVELSYRKYLLNQPPVFDSPECLEYISKSIPEGVSEEALDYPGECNPGIVFLNYHHPSCSLEWFDFNKMSRTQMQALNDDVMFPASCVILVERYLYVITTTPSMFRINIMKKEATWEEMTTPVDKYHGPAVVLEGILYVRGPGGDLESERVGSYDLEKGSWSRLPQKDFASTDSCMVAARKEVFVIGGISDDSWDEAQYLDTVVKDVESFDPRSSTWSTPVVSLNKRRLSASCCAHKDTIYVFGGSPSSDVQTVNDSVEILYPDRLVWQIVPLPEFSLEHTCSHYIDGKIYIVGSTCTSYSDIETVNVYDPDSKSVTSQFVTRDWRSYLFFPHQSAAVIM